MRTWLGTGGFSVDGSVRIEGEDRAGRHLVSVLHVGSLVGAFSATASAVILASGAVGAASGAPAPG